MLLNLKRLHVKLSYRKRLAEKLVLFFFSILLLSFLLRNSPNLLTVSTVVILLIQTIQFSFGSC